MSVQTVFLNQSNKVETGLADKISTFNGRGVVVADRAYQNKQQVEAGLGGPGTFKGLGRFLVTAALLFAAVVAAVSVGAVTLSLPSFLITAGVLVTGVLLINLFMRATAPTF